MLRRMHQAGFVILFLLVAQLCHAAEKVTLQGLAESGPSLTWSGFGTMGVVSGDKDDVYFVRELSQLGRSATTNGWMADSRLGVQVNLKMDTNWEAAVQMVARDKVGQTPENSVEWAFVSYRPTPDALVRVGRVGLDVFALSDFRSVGYAYHWVRPPTEFYGWLPVFSIDGADAAWGFDVEDTHVRAKVFAGSAQTEAPSGADAVLKLSINNLLGFGVVLERGDWRARAAHARLRTSGQFPVQSLIYGLGASAPVWPQASGLADQLNLDGAAVSYTSVGLAFDDGAWQVQSEFSRTESAKALLPHGDRVYVSVGRRMQAWLPFVSYARSTDPESTMAVAPPGYGLGPLQDGFNQAISTSRIRQSTWSAGVRWDFASNMALKVQADRTQVEAGGSGLWTFNRPWSGGTRSLLSASLDFVF